MPEIDAIPQERVGGSEVPRELIAEPPAGPSPAPPAAPSFSGFAEALARRQAAGDSLTGALTARETALTPRFDALSQSATERGQQIAANPPPKPPALAPPPSRGLRDFLAPTEGESITSTLSKMLTGLGVLATGASGLVRGNARSGLAAIAGAMKGWHEGDKERADRAFADWQAATETALKQHEMEVKSYRDVLENGKLSQDQMLMALKLDAQKFGLPVESALYGVQSAQDALKIVADQEKQAQELLRDWTKIGDARVKAEAEQAQKAAELSETERYHREKIEVDRLKASKEATLFKDLPTSVRAEILATPEGDALVKAGGQPTAAMVGAALEKADERISERLKGMGLFAAGIPKPTPPESMRRLEDLAVAQTYVAEMGRLSDSGGVRLDMVVGGVRPFINDKIQTGRLGPFPLPDSFAKQLTGDERRMLALMQDYADTILRLRSGAAINESEFRRMIGFIPEQSVTPETFRARLNLQEDLMRTKREIIREGLRGGNYRDPDIQAPPLAKDQPASFRIRRKSDGKLFEGSGAIPDGYERVK